MSPISLWSNCFRCILHTGVIRDLTAVPSDGQQNLTSAVRQALSLSKNDTSEACVLLVVREVTDSSSEVFTSALILMQGDETIAVQEEGGKMCAGIQCYY